ncbi:MAG: TRAP transporter fused permease subunit [Desulfobacteraceae bacterium]|nr:TRAP transporter fused permease subunit [Desulfobacteraceae bacterium]
MDTVEENTWAKVLRLATVIIAIVMGVYHILFMVTPLWGYSGHNIIHMGFAIALVILVFIASQTSRVKRGLLFLVMVASIGSLGYIFSQAFRLEMQMGMRLSDLDFAIGAILIIMVIIVTWLQWGWVLATVAILSLLFLFFGYHVPGPMKAPVMTPQYAMSFAAMNLGTGLFGLVTPLSSGIIFYFMLFSGVMAGTGVTAMFLEVGKAFGRLLRGGAALTAIIGSSLMGTVTGATAANVALTGSFTIPTMKSQGFRPSSASAIESVASSGGQIMPPIMGAGAFLMASMLGMPYVRIMQKAVLPALLYYGVTIIGTMMLIRHFGIKPPPEAVDKRLILTRAPVFLIPLGLLIVLLVQGHSPGWAAIWAMLACTVLSLFSKGTRPKSLWGFLQDFARGAISGAEIAIAFFAIALVSQAVITTGLAPKVSFLIIGLSQGIVFLGLLLVMVGCLILGMGMTTMAAYLLTAIVMVPSLTALGIDMVAGHFFAFYFAVFSAVTPPIATAAIVGSKIAKAGFWDCALQGFRLSLPLFLIPFAFIYQPQLLNFPHFGWGALYMSFILLASGLAVAMTIYRHLLVRLNNLEFVLSLTSTGLFAMYIIATQNWNLVLAAAVILVLAIVSQVIRWRSSREANSAGSY